MVAAKATSGRKAASAGKARGANGADGKAPAGVFTREERLDAYRQMLLIRRFEEKAGQLYGMGHIGGFCHLYIGQEAVVVGMQMALEPDDQVITAYRDHGHTLAVGMTAKSIMAELTGRRHGCSKGKGGSMHMFSPEKGFYGGHGIVGACVPLGAGLAFANAYRGNGRVCLTYFGDGAANQGQVYEAFNMAQLWKLPVVFIIENNKYAMGTSIERSSSTTNLSQRGLSFAIPGEHVNGMDVEEVRAAGAARHRACALRQGAVHPGDDDLPLPRPLDVRPGEVPHPRGGAAYARDAGPDRADPRPAHRGRRRRGRVEGHRPPGARGSQRGSRVRARRSRARRLRAHHRRLASEARECRRKS